MSARHLAPAQAGSAAASASSAAPAQGGAHFARPRVFGMGTRAVLLELGGLEAVGAWHAELLARPLPGQVEALAAAATVLIRFASERAALAARPLIGALEPRPALLGESREVRIEVVYDGEDLAEVARLSGLSIDAVIAAHTGTPWRAAFGGFAPGFTYLAGGDPRLSVPRRSSPRTAVPAGSVALGGEFSAAYPRVSPGGWQLLGRTDAVLWDLGREQPALIAPGDAVVFEAVRASASVGAASSVSLPDAAGSASVVPSPELPGLLVVAPGLRSLIQDLGRPGRGDLGVTASGAADEPSARQANRLVGNEPGAALIETTLGGLSVRASGDQVLALSGAPGEAWIGGDNARPAPLGAPFVLHSGETLTLGAPGSGLRGYLALRGGVAVPAQLGSAASDTLSGLGPAALAAGNTLVRGPLKVGAAVGHPESPATALPRAGQVVELRVTAGPRAEWFGASAADGAAQLCDREWAVTAQSDRVGVRLASAGEPLRRLREGELPSEGMTPGALQVPPSGQPVLFLADHPVTGGYPVIAVVVPQDLALAAQLPPGTPVSFRLVSGEETLDVAPGVTPNLAPSAVPTPASTAQDSNPEVAQDSARVAVQGEEA